MYKNIGKKISGLAKFVGIVGIVFSALIGLLIIAASAVAGLTAGVLVGILVIVIGSLFSWIGSLTMYGFGELITKTDEANASLKKIIEA